MSRAVPLLARAVAGGMFYYLKDYLPADLVVPVVLYCVTIATMGFRSFARPAGFPSGSVALGWMGAISFMVSDGALSISMFVYAFPACTYVVMITYYLAQMMIALSATSATAAMGVVPKKGGKGK